MVGAAACFATEILVVREKSLDGLRYVQWFWWKDSKLLTAFVCSPTVAFTHVLPTLQM